MQVLTDPAACGPVTLALCQDVQAEACDWPASLFAERVWNPRRTPPAREELARAAAVVRGARQPLVVCGGGVLYSEGAAAAARVLRPPRHPGGRDPGGQVRAACQPSAQSRRHRRHRHGRRQRARRGGRRHPRRRHPAAGLHHRLGEPVPRAEPADRGAQRATARCAQARRDPVAGRCARGPARARRRTRRLARPGCLDPARPRGAQPLAGRSRESFTAPLARGCPRMRRSSARYRGRRGRPTSWWRCRRPAGRAAQALAGRAAGRLSPRVRLLVHGLRDRRGARGQAGPSRPRSDRDGRRRLVPDAQQRDRHVDPAGREAHHRVARQRRFWLHRAAAALGGRCQLQQSAGQRARPELRRARARPRGTRQPGEPRRARWRAGRGPRRPSAPR